MAKQSILDEKQFLFIVGSPRSGTTWLHAMLGAHPSVCTTVELTLFNRYCAPWIEAWNLEAGNMKENRWNQGLPVVWSEEEFRDFLREFLEQVYEKVLKNNAEATHLLDKHPGYSLHTAEIRMLLPRAKFIHVIRDGRDVAMSMVAARRDIGFGAGTVAQAAAAWKRDLVGAREAAAFGDAYMEVRYEELSADPAGTLQQVMEFGGLETTRENALSIAQAHGFEKMQKKRISADPKFKATKGGYRKGKVGSWREEMAPIDAYFFHKTASELLRELDYADDPKWWARSIFEQLYLPCLGTVAFRRGYRTPVNKIIEWLLKIER